MKAFLSTLVIVLFITLPLKSAKEFKKINQWNHDDKGIYAEITRGIIDTDGHIIIRAEKQKTSIEITPKDIIFFAPWGQAGDDVYLGIAQCLYQEDIAIVEHTQRIKIFTKKNNKYAWKKTIWLKNQGPSQTIRSLIFFKDKWFIAGPYPLKEDKQNDVITLSFLRIMEREGIPIKDLIITQVKNSFKNRQMNYYVVTDGGRVLYMAEDELKVLVISPDELEVKKEIALKTPGYYKKMPEDFYVYKKKYFNDSAAFLKDIVSWQTGYSRIEHVIIDDGYLIIQTRTCDEKLKKFALLFYNLETFDLELTYFIDDMLLGSKSGQYYFYANGNPGKDDNTEECIINIYAFEDKK